MGVNDKSDLAKLEKQFQNNKRESFKSGCYTY